jgi:hypothetical protein
MSKALKLAQARKAKSQRDSKAAQMRQISAVKARRATELKMDSSRIERAS